MNIEEFDKFYMKQKLFEGDLCTVDGYGGKIWVVDGYMKQKSFALGEAQEDIIYNISCVSSGEWSIAMQEDTFLVCRAKYSEEYIEQLGKLIASPNNASNIFADIRDIFDNIMEGGLENLSLSDESASNEEFYVYPESEDGLLQKLSDLKFLEEQLKESKEEEISVVIEKLKSLQGESEH